MPEEELKALSGLVTPDEQRGRLSPHRSRELILKLCYGRFLTAVHLGTLMNRNPSALQARFLKPMVAEGLLRLRYPDKPNRPDQAYTAQAG